MSLNTVQPCATGFAGCDQQHIVVSVRVLHASRAASHLVDWKGGGSGGRGGGGAAEGYLEHREGMLGGGRDEPRQVGEHHGSGCSMSVQQHFGGPLYSTQLPLQLLTLSALILICNLLHNMLDQMNSTAYLHTATWPDTNVPRSGVRPMRNRSCCLLTDIRLVMCDVSRCLSALQM